MVRARWMLIGLGLGASAGLGVNLTGLEDTTAARVLIDYVAYPAGQIFLRLLFMLVMPLLFAALVLGVSELRPQQLGRMALKTLGYTLVVSTVAVLIGMSAVNLLGPGRGMSDALRAEAVRLSTIKAAPAPADASPLGLFIAIIPDNPVRAAAQGDMVAVIAFALIFGIGLALTAGEPAQRLREVLQGVYDVCMRLLQGVLRLAPFGVGALVFGLTTRLGFELLGQVAAYVGVVLLALGLHMTVVYSLSVRFFGGRNPVTFFKDVRLAIATAFATSSSSATLPTSLKVAEENLKLPRTVSRFVLTAGATMNQNGTALFEGVTVLFLAQVFEVDLSWAQQAGVMAICILAGIGTAGVPAGSLPVIAMILAMFGIPPEGLGLVLGVDRFLDMCRTTLNVTGDLAAAVYVARGYEEENEAPP